MCKQREASARVTLRNRSLSLTDGAWHAGQRLVSRDVLLTVKRVLAAKWLEVVKA